MASTRRHGYGSSAARLLGVLGVLLGLLAMHGLASTHHHAAAPWLVPPAAVHVPPAAVHAAAGVHSAGPETAGSHSHTEHALASNTSSLAGSMHDTSAGRGDGAAVGALPVPACDGHCPSDVAALCLAVLACASAVALLAAAARRRVGPQPPAPARKAGVQLLRHLSLVTPDPVKDLCVSRT